MFGLMTSTTLPADRAGLVRRGRWLSWATLGYNSIEGILAIAVGLAASSTALVGFGIDSVVELSASVIALWRLGADADPARREAAERRSRRLIGLSFLALASYVAIDAAGALLRREPPDEAPIGIAIAAVSLVVMPLLARAKRRVAVSLGSPALQSEARQTLFCTWLSAILLAGLGLHALAGWWWADPVAALAMVPIIAHEGIEGLQGRDACHDAC